MKQLEKKVAIQTERIKIAIEIMLELCLETEQLIEVFPASGQWKHLRRVKLQGIRAKLEALKAEEV